MGESQEWPRSYGQCEVGMGEWLKSCYDDLDAGEMEMAVSGWTRDTLQMDSVQDLGLSQKEESRM
jgi:hypothetical protein